MKTLYLDIFSGISGDMFIGAMLDLGVDLAQFERELRKLGVGSYHLHAKRQQNSHIEGIKFDVHIHDEHHHDEHEHHHDEHEHEHDHDHGHNHHHDHEHAHRHDHEHDHAHEPSHSHEHSHAHGHEESRDFAEIKRLIQSSALSAWVKERSVSIFHRIAVAEGKIHGHPPDQVHFHEVGAIDSIVDIVGACIALEMLAKPRIIAAPVVDGTGWVDCAHGRFPVPTTATLEILAGRGIGITQCDEPHELVTPTGAALLAEFAERFEPMRDLAPAKIGYGLGTRQNKTRPNVLRAILGDQPIAATSAPGAGAKDWETDTIVVLETNLDDCSGEILGHFVERAFAAGALDVFHTPIQMKKNRPGVLLTVLCADGDADRFSEMLLRETSAFGVRRATSERRKLRRRTTKVQTPFGEVTMKLGEFGGEVLHTTPEFESCKKLAAAAQVPLRAVYEAAEQANRALRTKTSTP